MTDLQGWQKVAREIGDYDMKNAWGTIFPEDLEPRTDDFIGQWLPAEAAAKEILRLRERVAVLERVREAAEYAVNWVGDPRWQYPLVRALAAAKPAAQERTEAP